MAIIKTEVNFKFDNRVFLIGPMGSGKSTIGRLLAKALHYPFIDTDEVIVNRLGTSIANIFAISGEEYFRQYESKIIEELTLESPIVISTGGGSILTKKNREILRKRGHVVYLNVSPVEQYKRVQHDKNRPLLQNDSPQLTIQQLFKAREPLYKDSAHYIINSDQLTPSEVVDEIIRNISNHPVNVR